MLARSTLVRWLVEEDYWKILAQRNEHVSVHWTGNIVVDGKMQRILRNVQRVMFSLIGRKFFILFHSKILGRIHTSNYATAYFISKAKVYQYN